jgi:hypothetical protein
MSWRERLTGQVGSQQQGRCLGGRQPTPVTGHRGDQDAAARAGRQQPVQAGTRPGLLGKHVRIRERGLEVNASRIRHSWAFALPRDDAELPIIGASVLEVGVVDTRKPEPDREPDRPELAEQEIREYTRRLRALPVDQVIVEALFALLNAAEVKLGRRDARLLIDVVARPSWWRGSTTCWGSCASRRSRRKDEPANRVRPTRPTTSTVCPHRRQRRRSRRRKNSRRAPRGGCGFPAIELAEA